MWTVNLTGQCFCPGFNIARYVCNDEITRSYCNEIAIIITTLRNTSIHVIHCNLIPESKHSKQGSYDRRYLIHPLHLCVQNWTRNTIRSNLSLVRWSIRYKIYRLLVSRKSVGKSGTSFHHTVSKSVQAPLGHLPTEHKLNIDPRTSPFGTRNFSDTSRLDKRYFAKR